MTEKIIVYPYRRINKNKTRKKRSGFGKPDGVSGSSKGVRKKERDLTLVSSDSEEVQKKDKQKVKLNGPYLSGCQLILCIAGFFLGKALLLGELFPFASAFAAAVSWIYGSPSIIAILGVIIGQATVVKGVSLMVAAGTVILIWILPRNISEEAKRSWLVPGAALAVTLIVKTAYLTFVDPSPYEYVSVFLEALFAGILTLVFLNALRSFHKLNGSQNLSPEELFCMMVFVTSIIAGAEGINIWGISLEGLFSRLIILIAAFVGGMGLGSAAGALTGVIPGLVYSIVPVMIGAYSFAGLLAGLCRGFGKPGIAVGFFLGNIILSVYVQSFGELAAVMVETGLAALFFFLIPSRYMGEVTSSLSSIVYAFPVVSWQESQMKATVTAHIHKWSQIFRELSHGFAQACASVPGARQEPALQSLFNEISEKVCSGCTLYRTCWEREFYLTYQSFLDMFTLVEIYGMVTVEDLPQNLKKRCTRCKELVITITCMYDTYKLNRYWARKFSEGRQILSEQLKGLSEIIEKLSTQLQFEVEKATQREILLKERLKKAGVPAIGVKVSRQENGQQEVALLRQACSNKTDCYQRVVTLISKLMDKQIAPATRNCIHNGEELCHIRFYPALKYQVELGMARMSKDGSPVSGDSYTILPLQEGRLALVLSDGMGTGPQAALESNMVVNLLTHLLESGFCWELAVKTVNSMLMLRFQEDSFATVDMAILNLYNGQTEFVKIGASPSFLMRGNRVGLIQANSLPVGIIGDIDVTPMIKNLVAGDVLVMLSDGVLDASGNENEDWVREVLRQAGTLAPQELADLLLKLAQTASTKSSDDMTVLVARLEKYKK